MKKYEIVIGGNAGDEGKGTVTATYTKHAEGPVMNVLTNGGAQRAHTIFLPEAELQVTNKHFGSGTAYGADNFFSEWFILNPVQFVIEYSKDFIDNHFKEVTFYRHPRCMWSTPWDMMAGIIINKGKFASCGMGIWETILRYKSMNTYTLSAFMAMTPEQRNEYIRQIKDYYAKRLSSGIPEEFRDAWFNEGMKTHFISDCQFMVDHTISCARPSFDGYEKVILENGQGLLLCDRGLDESDRTPSLTDSYLAKSLLTQQYNVSPDDITLHYVTRPYFTRHGKGMLELGECSSLTSDLKQDTNVWNEFQGDFRYGKLDIAALKSRILHDNSHYDMVLEVTHCDEMDRVKEFSEAFSGIADIKTYDSKYIL